MPEETGETLCEARGNVKGNRGKHVGNCQFRGFLGHLAPVFKALYIDGTTHQCWGIPNAFPAHFSL